MDSTTLADWLQDFPTFERRRVCDYESPDGILDFRVCSWNVLADAYALQNHFPQKSSDELLWEHRFPLMTETVRDIAADILCLQEVDHFEEWRNFLCSERYEFRYKQRPSKPDGCLIAWKPSEFELLQEIMIDFDHFMPSGRTLERRYRKGNVAIVCIFRRKQSANVPGNNPNKPFILANCHLYWDPNKEDVKLLQAHILMKHVESIQMRCSENFCQVPVIVCGDMNTLPGQRVYRYFVEGSSSPMVQQKSNGLKFVCENALADFCCWLRLLGFDCTLETEEEAELRSRNQALIILDRALSENRLVLVSRELPQKKEYAEVFLVDVQDLEESLICLFRYNNIVPNPANFSTICVQCNTYITRDNSLTSPGRSGRVAMSNTSQGQNAGTQDGFQRVGESREYLHSQSFPIEATHNRLSGQVNRMEQPGSGVTNQVSSGFVSWYGGVFPNRDENAYNTGQRNGGQYSSRNYSQYGADYAGQPGYESNSSARFSTRPSRESSGYVNSRWPGSGGRSERHIDHSGDRFSNPASVGFSNRSGRRFSNGERSGVGPRNTFNNREEYASKSKNSRPVDDSSRVQAASSNQLHGTDGGFTPAKENTGGRDKKPAMDGNREVRGLNGQNRSVYGDAPPLQINTRWVKDPPNDPGHPFAGQGSNHEWGRSNSHPEPLRQNSRWKEEPAPRYHQGGITGFDFPVCASCNQSRLSEHIGPQTSFTSSKHTAESLNKIITNSLKDVARVDSTAGSLPEIEMDSFHTCNFQNQSYFANILQKELNHSLKLSSCFATLSSPNTIAIESRKEFEEPAFTNLRCEFSGTLDYIFISPEWSRTGKLKLPTTNVTTLEQDNRSTTNALTLPLPNWPSDHLCLACDLLL